MLYTKFQAFLLQERESASEEYAFVCEPDDLGIDPSKIDDIYPIESKTWLLYYGVREGQMKNEQEAFLLPQFNDPKILILNPNEVSSYKSEFFFYHDQRYIVYMKSVAGLDHIIYEIYHLNGSLEQIIKLKFKGLHNHSEANIITSPSGRYFLYVEESDSLLSKSKSKRPIGQVLELNINQKTRKFEFTLIRKIDNFYENYGLLSEQVNSRDFNLRNELYLTDNKEILYINKSKEILMFEDIEYQDEVYQKLGKQEDNSNRYRTLFDVICVPKNGGFAFYTESDVYFLRINSETRTVLPLIKINFRISKAQMVIDQVCPSIDPSLIVISLKQKNDSLLIVWNVDENKEVSNFSTSNKWIFVTGPNNKAGFLLNKDVYVNLDYGLVNYFFEHRYLDYGFSNKNGFRITHSEKYILENGCLLTKETIVELSALDDLINERFILHSMNISLEKIRFQVDGNTSLHYFALEFDTLNLILEYFDLHRQEYLLSILMKNNDGKSPLDIALDNESPRNAELMLNKLTIFKDENFSGLFYDRFNELLEMNITAFHEYLESCLFQTVQMKLTHYLDLKNKSLPWLVTHSSCLIDEVFIEKYCNADTRNILRDRNRRKSMAVINIEHFDSSNLTGKQKVKDANETFQKMLNESKREDENDSQVISKESGESDSSSDNSSSQSVDSKEISKLKSSQKRLDIRAIEFDWIFNDTDGVRFLETLSETDSIELFDLTIIRHIINFLWSYFKFYVLMYSLIPYLFYMALFLVYVTYFHKVKYEMGYDYMQGFGVLSDLSNLILLVYILYFLYFEIRQLLFHKMNYLSSFWNMIDMTSLLLNLFIQIIDLANVEESKYITFSGIAVLFVWLKLFYFGRIFASTATIISIVIEITYDMKYFLGVLLLSIGAFGNCFYILARNNTEYPDFAGSSFLNSFLYSYIQALGQFDTTVFVGTDKHLYFTIFFLNTMISMIVMLNMLVAIMGDTFDRVMDTAESSMYRELAATMYENEMIMNRKRIFGDAKYIIVIQEEKAEESDIGWEGKIKYLKNFLSRQSFEQTKILKDIEKEILTAIKSKAEKRGKELELSSNKQFQVLFENFNYLENLVQSHL